MTIYFSKSTLGFYDDALGSIPPADAVEITAEQRKELLDGQRTGQIIAADSSGNPVLEAPAPLTVSQKQLILAQQAKAALAESDITIIRITEAVIGDRTNWTAADLEPWAAYRSTLRAIVAGTSTATSLPTAPSYPEGS